MKNSKKLFKIFIEAKQLIVENSFEQVIGHMFNNRNVEPQPDWFYDSENDQRESYVYPKKEFVVYVLLMVDYVFLMKEYNMIHFYMKKLKLLLQEYLFPQLLFKDKVIN